MGYQLRRLVLWNAKSKGWARMVVGEIADAIRDDEPTGIAWPGVDRLATILGVNRRSAIRAIEAAEAAGVDYGTFNDWMHKGEQEERGKFRQFNQQVRKAEAECRLNFTRVIQRAAAQGDWKAAEAYLKRRDRSNWGDNVDVTSGGDKITEIRVIWDDHASSDTPT